MTSPPIKTTISNIGGIRHAELELHPGVNVLRGRNGAGKSSAMNAITRALGGDVALEVRDGEPSGSVSVGGVALEVRRVVRATGRAEVALADVAPLGDLIDPGIKDPEAANRARVRALLALVPMPIDDLKLLALAAGDPEIVEATLRDRSPRTLLEASEDVRLTAHYLAREKERETAELSGQRVALDAQVEQLGGDLVLFVPDEPEAQAAVRYAEERLRELDLRAAERARVLASQEKAREALQAIEAARVAPEAADDALAIAKRKLHDAEEEHAKALEWVSSTRSQVVICRDAFDRATVAADQARVEARQVETLRAALASAAPEVKESERLNVREELAEAQTKLDYAKKAAHVRALRAQADEVEGRRQEAEKRAVALRTAATTVGQRLGALLAGTNASPFTLTDEGRLAVVDGQAVHDFATRRSDGQRIKAALAVAVRAYPSGVVPLSGRAWTALDGSARGELARLAAAAGLYVLTEEPDNAPELHLDHQGAES